MALTILEGSTFCICNERGDIDGETQGLFADDTRFLSQLRLTINGALPLLLSSGKVEYFSAAFYLRNPIAGGLPADTVSITRQRFVGEGMQDLIVVQNQGMEPLSFELAIELGTDFADILSVKAHDFALGDPAHATPLPEPVESVYEEDENQFVLRERDGEGVAATQVIFSQRGEITGAKVAYDLELAPREVWELRLDILASIDGDSVPPHAAERRFGEEMTRVRESLAAWQLRVPQIRSDWDDLARSFLQSVSDLASLRMRGGGRMGRLPAAGMPWFMTVFGRDTLITCLQTLLFGPELARAALEVLAELQATRGRPRHRRGAGQDRPRAPVRQGCAELVPRLLRDRRCDPALPRPALRGLALDRRLGAGARAQGARAARAPVDRRVRRPGRRRVRRVRAPVAARPLEPVVEGLGRLPALPRRDACAGADRAVRGPGLRLRREASCGRARSRDLARSPARRAARAGRRRTQARVQRALLDGRARRLLRARA